MRISVILVSIALGCGGQVPIAGTDAAVDAPVDAPDWTHVGSIDLHNVNATNRRITELSTAFGYAKTPTLPACGDRDANGCRVCEPDGDAGMSMPPDRQPSLGTLTVSLGSSRVVLTPNDGDGIEYSCFALWSGPATVRLQSTGADVPPFDQMLDVPGQITVTSLSATTMTPRTAPLTLAWTGGSGQVHLTLTSLLLPGQRVDCEFAAAAGQGRVDPSMLGQLPPGDAILVVEVETDRAITAGDWAIQLTARAAAVNPDQSEVQPREILLQ